MNLHRLLLETQKKGSPGMSTSESDSWHERATAEDSLYLENERTGGYHGSQTARMAHLITFPNHVINPYLQ